MRLIKTSEKISVWMFRTSITQQVIADRLGISRQTFSAKLKDNFFSPRDLIILKEMGFSEE